MKPKGFKIREKKKLKFKRYERNRTLQEDNQGVLGQQSQYRLFICGILCKGEQEPR
jgi:hypothetical protein